MNINFIEVLKSIILGIVQGITEWLPISSTGHMILVDEFMKMSLSQDFIDMFLVLIQFGSILAVLVLYFNKLNPFSPKKASEEKRSTLLLWGKVIAGVVPAAIVGFFFDDLITKYCFNSYVVAATLIIYGILFIIVEKLNIKPKVNNLNELTFVQSYKIGLFQILALIPGTSRSGSTILGACMIGTNRKVAAEFSFFLAIPVMFGASLLKIVKYCLKSSLAFGATEIAVLLVGMLVAFIVSIVAIKFLMSYIQKHSFKAFGYYRIILGIIVLGYFLVFNK